MRFNWDQQYIGPWSCPYTLWIKYNIVYERAMIEKDFDGSWNSCNVEFKVFCVKYTRVQVKAISESWKLSAKSENISTGTNIEFILRNGAKNVTFEKAKRDQMKK